MSSEYAAFLSYSHRDVGWVEALQKNLEAVLDEEVFRDKTDLRPGYSWVTGLQQGLNRARSVILVATPEALASPRVADEFESLIAKRPDWRRGRLQIVHLIDCPLPTFLGPIETLDFRNHDDRKYRRVFRELVGALTGAGRRNAPEITAELTVPPVPRRPVHSDLWMNLVHWLTPKLEDRERRFTVAGCLGTDAKTLDDHPSPDCAASALLVQYEPRKDRVPALLGMTRKLEDAFGAGAPEDPTSLAAIRAELERLESMRGPGGAKEALWLDKVARDHKNLLPYFEAGAQDLLFRVHVELQVAPEIRDPSATLENRAIAPASEAKVGHRSADPESGLDLLSILSTERGSRAWATGRYVVLGDPGAGKSTMLRHLAGSLARQAEEGHGPLRWIPVYERLPTWLTEGDALPERLEESLCRVDAKARGFARQVEGWATEGRLLFLLDGLDEVDQDQRESAEALLRGLVARWPASPVVVASRPIGYQRLGEGFTELRLLELNDPQKKELLAHWLGRHGPDDAWADAETAWKVLQEDRWLKRLAGNPLYLTLMAMLFETDTRPEHNPTRLYDQIFDLLMKGKHRQRHRPVAMDAQATTRRVLQRLAFGMTLDNRMGESLDRLEERLDEEEMTPLRRKLESRKRWKGSLRTFFLDLAERTGILGPHDGDEADWRYWHRTFREALAAERLEEVIAEEGKEAVLARAGEITEDEDASRWAEPYALLAGRVEEPDRLVTELVEVNRPLGLRALASARTLKTETVVEILGLTGNVEERAQVYQELPRLVGDGRAVLDLVERLRPETRDGNDLFWLDWVAREVGRGDGELAVEVERVLGRFFDHIPAPPVEVFREVETPRDGKVPLWCTIPPEDDADPGDGVVGSFRMGSPEGEGDPDERPQHWVEFRSRFRLAAVPVTRAQYALFDPDHKSYGFEGVPEEELAHHPVNQVSWWAAVSFCRWLSRSVPELAGARLPTEAEWEYACRAGTETAYWKGNGEAALKKVGWYDGNSGNRTHRVGELPANDWGLFDVHGNVWEWALDRRADYRDRGRRITVDPQTVDLEGAMDDDPGGGWRVVRGGSYDFDASWARSAYRDGDRPGLRWGGQGFRVALPAAPSEPRS